MATTSSGSTESATTPSPPRARPADSIIPMALTAGNVDNGGDTTTNEEATEEESEDRRFKDPEEALHPEWLDEIRFMSYRTAAKLRLLQKRTGLVQIDIWNMIESFRENGLNVADPETRITRPRLETLVGSMYANLAKRIPTQPGSNSYKPKLESMASWLLSWLLTALNPSQNEKVIQLKVRTLKTSLAVLCSGKLMDKLRYVFSLISDENGHMVHAKYASFVRDVVRIPRAVGEEYKIQLQQTTFEPGSLVTLNDFLEALMSDPGPQCLSWLPVLHRIVAAENVVHQGMSCGSCGTKAFRGLRYKSDRSKNYHLCQWCFWRGRIPSDHRDDVFKEFNTFKTSSNARSDHGSQNSGCGIKKSLHCMAGGSGKSKTPKFPELENPLDLSNMIPSPLPSIRSLNNQQRQPPSYTQEFPGYAQPQPFYAANYEDPPTQFTDENEHQLIAHYAQELDQGMNTIPDPANRPHMLQHSRELVYELERKNQEIMHDIERLRQSHNPGKRCGGGGQPIMSELQGLRSHKIELESRLEELQCARKDLMDELDELMKLLKVQQEPVRPQQAYVQPMMMDVMNNAAESNHSFTNVAGMGIEQMAAEYYADPMQQPYVDNQYYPQPAWPPQPQQQPPPQPQYAAEPPRPPVIGGSTSPSPNRSLSKDKGTKHVRKASKRLEKSKAIVVDDDEEVAAATRNGAAHQGPRPGSRPGSSQRPGSRNASVVSLSD